ncbi:MAG: hypothetical protein KDC35_04105 [Acidobacteria bacterium]|nr:hypothetical protein [Acidobacteriota bacterium]
MSVLPHLRVTTIWSKSNLSLMLAAIIFAVSLYLQAVIGYFAALIMLCAVTRDDAPRLAKFLTMILFLVALPDLSDDYHRYLWEGYLGLKGYSPYLYAPATLADIVKHPSGPLVNNPHLTAIYPPLAQWMFRLGAFVHPSIWGWKCIIALSFLVSYAFDRSTLKLAFVPIVLFEGFWNNHLDVLGVILLWHLPKALERKQPALAGALLGLVCALKIVPILWLPFMFTSLLPQMRRQFLASFALAAMTPWLFHADEGFQLWTSFLVYTKTWSFNNLLYHCMQLFATTHVARIALISGFVVVYVAIFFSEKSWRTKALLSWLALICFSPTFYPWYLLWLVPLVTHTKHINGLYACSFLSYAVLLGFRKHGVWQESWWWLVPEWIGLGLFAFIVVKEELQ